MNKGRQTPKRKKSFIFYCDWAEALIDHPEELRHKIVDAFLRFALYGEEPTDVAVKYSVFALMQRQLQADAEKYAEVCEKRRANINSRWNKADTDTREYNCIQENTREYKRIQMHYDNDSDNDNVNDSDNVNDNVCVCDKSHNTTHTHAHTHEENLFIKFLEWSKEFAPLSLQFKEALTLEHFLWLLQTYGEEKVKRCAQALHNKEAHKHNRRAITAWQNYIKKM